MNELTGPLVVIRKMTEADAPGVAAIEREVFSEPWTEANFADACQNSNYCYLVATISDQIIGYAGCTIVCEDADITNIAVATEQRQMGIGAKLLEVLMAQAKLGGANSVFLEVRESNEAAQRLYRKAGFAYIGRRKNFYRFPDEDALLMQAKIEE